MKLTLEQLISTLEDILSLKLFGEVDAGEGEGFASVH